MDWEGLRISRRLGISVATAARRIDALEKALGLRLFDRSPDGIVLTTHGRALEARATPAVAAIADIDRLAAALRSGAWPDPIRVSATEPVIAEILAPSLPVLLTRAPELKLELSVSTEVVSLAAREAELAIRLARPSGDSLIARRLPDVAFGLFAAHTYLAGRRPADLVLSRERLLGYDMSYGRIAEIAWLEEAGRAGALTMITSSTRALLTATRAGAGLALLPRFLVRGAPELIEIPSPRPLPRRSPWLVWHRDLARARPLRVVRDWIVAAFRDARTS